VIDEPTLKSIQFPATIPRRAWMVPSLVPLLRHGKMVHLRVNERGEIVRPKELCDWLRLVCAEPEGGGKASPRAE
jgi:hypothetical protein